MNNILSFVTGSIAGLAAAACDELDTRLSETCVVTKRQLAIGAVAVAAAGLVCGVLMASKRTIIIQNQCPAIDEEPEEEDAE